MTPQRNLADAGAFSRNIAPAGIAVRPYLHPLGGLVDCQTFLGAEKLMAFARRGPWMSNCRRKHQPLRAEAPRSQPRWAPEYLDYVGDGEETAAARTRIPCVSANRKPSVSKKAWQLTVPKLDEVLENDKKTLNEAMSRLDAAVVKVNDAKLAMARLGPTVKDITDIMEKFQEAESVDHNLVEMLRTKIPAREKAESVYRDAVEAEEGERAVVRGAREDVRVSTKIRKRAAERAEGLVPSAKKPRT